MPHLYVYAIVNTVNGHTYVGQRTSRVPPEDDVYWGSGLLIKRAIKKYGLDAFRKVILERNIQTKPELNAREIYWISLYKKEGRAEYNIAPGGTGGDLLRNAPELQKEATRRYVEACRKRSPEKRAAIGAKMSRIVKDYWAGLSPEQKELLRAQSSYHAAQSYKNPEFYKRKCALNAKNGPIQSATQNDSAWIESVGKAAHIRQNIHVASGFFMDLDGKLYTRKALVSVLGCSNNAPLAFTANWEKRMTPETHAKWHARFRWIENTPENDKTYNFEKNVITGCYTQRIKDV